MKNNSRRGQSAANIFWGVALVSILILGGCAQAPAPTSSNTQKPNASVPPNATVIHMTKDGFSPATIAVSQNSAVTFTNEDAVPHWPASNIHPTHGIYPEFDPKEEVPPGMSWTFVFDKIGTWRFHDHLNPTWIGQVKVTEHPVE